MNCGHQPPPKEHLAGQLQQTSGVKHLPMYEKNILNGICTIPNVSEDLDYQFIWKFYLQNVINGDDNLSLNGNFLVREVSEANLS